MYNINLNTHATFIKIPGLPNKFLHSINAETFTIDLNYQLFENGDEFYKNCNKNSKKSTRKINPIFCLETRILLHHRSPRSIWIQIRQISVGETRISICVMRVSSMPIVGKIPRPESGWIRISDRQVRLPAWPRVLLRTRLQFPPHSIFTVRTPSVHLFPRVSRSRGGGKRECCLLDEFHEFSWWRGARVVLPPLPVARPTLDYALVTSKSRRERPNWNETRENWGGNWGASPFESQILERIFFFKWTLR